MKTLSVEEAAALVRSRDTLAVPLGPGQPVAFLRALAPRLVCLVEGRVAADGPTERVIADPRVIDAYLGRAALASKRVRP